eukprot:2990659-Amphidinium_carterae.1
MTFKSEIPKLSTVLKVSRRNWEFEQRKGPFGKRIPFAVQFYFPSSATLGWFVMAGWRGMQRCPMLSMWLDAQFRIEKAPKGSETRNPLNPPYTPV